MPLQLTTTRSDKSANMHSRIILFVTTATLLAR